MTTHGHICTVSWTRNMCARHYLLSKKVSLIRQWLDGTRRLFIDPSYSLGRSVPPTSSAVEQGLSEVTTTTGICQTVIF